MAVSQVLERGHLVGSHRPWPRAKDDGVLPPAGGDPRQSHASQRHKASPAMGRGVPRDGACGPFRGRRRGIRAGRGSRRNRTESREIHTSRGARRKAGCFCCTAALHSPDGAASTKSARELGPAGRIVGMPSASIGRTGSVVFYYGKRPGGPTRAGTGFGSKPRDGADRTSLHSTLPLTPRPCSCKTLCHMWLSLLAKG